MAWPDFDQIGKDLATVIRDNVSGFEQVSFETDETDALFGNMPLCSISIDETVPEIRAGQDYYIVMGFAIVIEAFDLSERPETVTVRNDLVKATIETITANPRFQGDVETTIVGRIDFVTGEEGDDEGGSSFIAAARIEVAVTAFADRS